MLQRLTIKNYAIIPELDLHLQNGLSIITGETGAGKSILLGALGLALGKRADSRVLPDDQTKCIVEAHFKLSNDALKNIFESEDLDFQETLICRREITSGGRSRAFINDTPVQSKLLQEVTSHLIELHHQHDNLALQQREYQVNLLDTISHAQKALSSYQDTFRQLTAQKNELKRMRDLEASSARRKDFLQFQMEELKNANLIPGELERLEQEENMLTNAEAIGITVQMMRSILSDGQHAVTTQLTQLIRQLDSVRTLSEDFSELANRIEQLRVEADDITLETGKLENIARHDQNHLSKVQARLNVLYSLIKKYQAKDDITLIEQYDQLEAEYAEIASAAHSIQEIEDLINKLTEELVRKGERLSEMRLSGAKKVIPKMLHLLKELGMPNAQFTIELHPSTPGSDGADDIQFMFTANKGMPMQPLQSVASGGELSRVSLALKSLYADQASLPTIIFDEIDTGISGEVAWRMGQLIHQLAQGRQILMITHSPQIAAHAGTQYHVSKSDAQGRDASSIQLLTQDMRFVEIAKMLSGDPPSKEALANAKSLVASTQS